MNSLFEEFYRVTQLRTTAGRVDNASSEFWGIGCRSSTDNATQLPGNSISRARAIAAEHLVEEGYGGDTNAEPSLLTGVSFLNGTD